LGLQTQVQGGIKKELLTFSVLVTHLKNLLHAGGNLARGLVNKKKRTNRASLAANPPHPTLLERKKLIKNKHKARTIKRKKRTDGQKGIHDASTCIGATQISVGLVLVQNSSGSSARPIDVALQVLRFCVRQQTSPGGV
jgi:hypothetical protein